jgi:hypothetical protein
LKTKARDNRATIVFYDIGGWSQRAIFERSEPDEWKLRSLTFQCPACIGGAIIDEGTCILCDGSGWGVS